MIFEIFNPFCEGEQGKISEQPPTVEAGDLRNKLLALLRDRRAGRVDIPTPCGRLSIADFVKIQLQLIEIGLQTPASERAKSEFFEKIRANYQRAKDQLTLFDAIAGRLVVFLNNLSWEVTDPAVYSLLKEVKKARAYGCTFHELSQLEQKVFEQFKKNHQTFVKLLEV